MKIDRQKIIDTYEAIEAEAGGIQNIDVVLAIAQVCQRLNIHKEIADEVLISHWTQNGAG
jgi:hypothetical protein